MKFKGYSGKKVFVAMSGGVDSSVAAALLKEAGCEVFGVTMCFDSLFPYTKKVVAKAKEIAKYLSISHYTVDFADMLSQEVIKVFISEYLEGRTPNPCVYCNRAIKFGRLWNRVRSMGAEYLATGHYARIVYNDTFNRFELYRGYDKKKDQSYFLSFIKKDVLPFILFPLGEMTKEDVYKQARLFGLKLADHKESQDICFIPEGDYKEFIRQQAGEQAFVKGVFKDEAGNIVGEHQGIVNYTIGQREKLGIALGRRVYVYKIDSNANTIFVGDKDNLTVQKFTAVKLNWLVEIPKKNMELGICVRYNAAEVKARIFELNNDVVYIEVLSPCTAIAPGQFVVFYKRGLVLGSGVIDRVLE